MTNKSKKFSNQVKPFFILVGIFLVLSITACQPTIYLMRPPVALSPERNPFEDTPDARQNSSIRIAYATNRQSGKPKEDTFYTRQFDQDLRFGLAFVQIGDGEDSWDQVLKWSTTPDREEVIPLSLTGVERRGVFPENADTDRLTEDLQRTFDAMNELIRDNPIKDITVYVHGANANFYRAATQAAQFRHFSGRNDLMMFYAWPTAENFLRYKTDLKNIKATVSPFTRFISLLSKHTEAEKINILGYSAGAKLVSETLAVFGASDGGMDRQAYRDKLRLGTIYLAGGDVDLQTFVQNLALYEDLVENVTVTINDKDIALRISKWLSGASRAGSPDIEEIDEHLVDWLVDLSNSPRFDIVYIDPEVIPDAGLRSHSYWYTSSWVSNDALSLLNFRSQPPERGLKRVGSKRGFEIWTFPPDYLDRIRPPTQ